MLKIKRVLLLVWQSAPRLSIAKIILIFLQGILPLVSLYMTKLVVDAISGSISAVDSQEAMVKIIWLFAIAGGIALITNISTSLADIINSLQTQKVTDYMESIIHDKAIAIDLEYYENAEYYDKLQRAQEQAPYLPTRILDRIAGIAQNTISLVAILGLLFSLHWLLAIVIFLVGIPTMLVRIKYSRIRYRWQRKRTPLRRRTGYFNLLLTKDKPAKEIRLFNLGSIFSQRFRLLRRQLYQESLAITIARSRANSVAQSISGMVMFFAYGFIVFRTINGLLTLGDLALYHQAFKRGQTAFTNLLTGISGFYEDKLFLANLYEFLDLEPKILETQYPKSLPQPMQQGIEFCDVDFFYPNTTRQALKNISLAIKPGETIALVGENGSGKTTLIKLLCRLYEPTSGSITIDGINLQNFAINDLRQEISVIFQDYMQYHLTAEENIRLGNIAVPSIDESIFAAAMRSGAHEVITKLPQGYQTVLGKLFEQGEELSIGQWQKIALARAFLRKSQVIVLDEPTSAMDAQAEAEIFANFRQLIKNQTAILITHRLSTVKMADRIFVMDKGSLIENGTHEELIRLQGTYTRLFETQAMNYR